MATKGTTVELSLDDHMDRAKLQAAAKRVGAGGVRQFAIALREAQASGGKYPTRAGHAEIRYQADTRTFQVTKVGGGRG